MIPTAFALERPESIEDAVRLLVDAGEEAKVLAGGHSLVPLMRLRLAAPETIVDLGRIDGLSYIRQDGDRIAIGALTTHTAVEQSELLRDRCLLLAEAAAEVGDIQVRNRGTIGGSLAHADPNADLPAAAVALDAELVATGSNGQRTIRAREFFVDYMTTVLEPTEILTEVRVPALDGAGSAYLKFSRRSQDWAIVGCAAIVRGDDETVVWTGVGPTPVLAQGDWRTAADGLHPTGDLSGSAEYKKHLAKVLAERALAKARNS
ncbi:MAG: xanthine dehydrogenase family protein subunit M [Actinobacteria bacterium]|nr:xanthine dehydrogenase family protein subunit M [Actinomycetota bacterium]